MEVLVQTNNLTKQYGQHKVINIKRFVHFNIDRYMLDSNIFQIGVESTEPAYTRAAVGGLIFLLIEIILSFFVMHKKEIE